MIIVEVLLLPNVSFTDPVGVVNRGTRTLYNFIGKWQLHSLRIYANQVAHQCQETKQIRHKRTLRTTKEKHSTRIRTIKHFRFSLYWHVPWDWRTQKKSSFYICQCRCYSQFSWPMISNRNLLWTPASASLAGLMSEASVNYSLASKAWNNSALHRWLTQQRPNIAAPMHRNTATWKNNCG